jgi:hypothetical protein
MRSSGRILSFAPSATIPELTSRDRGCPAAVVAKLGGAHNSRVLLPRANEATGVLLIAGGW